MGRDELRPYEGKPRSTVRRLVTAGLLALYLFMWVGGLVAYLFLDGPPAHVAWTAPAFLLLAALLVLAGTAPALALRLLAAGLLGFAAEVVGVRTGWVFGAYGYSPALGPRWLGVPWVLAAAWLVLLAYSREMAARWPLPRWGRVAAGAQWMVALDLVLDPVAAGPLGYWRWQEGGGFYGVPLVNFAGWLGVSLVLLVPLGQRPDPRPWGRWVGMSVLLFFTVLAAGFGLSGPALVGVTLLAADLASRGGLSSPPGNPPN